MMRVNLLICFATFWWYMFCKRFHPALAAWMPRGCWSASVRSLAACFEPFFFAPFVSCGFKRSQFEVVGFFEAILAFFLKGRLGLAMVAVQRRAMSPRKWLERSELVWCTRAVPKPLWLAFYAV